VSAKRAPSGLGKSGQALWKAVNEQYSLAPHESAILVQCCRVTDRLDAIEAELTGAPLTVEGSAESPPAARRMAGTGPRARVTVPRSVDPPRR
jgi:hypothetical protein